VLLSTTGLVLSLDQLTKNAVVNHFRLGESLSVFPTVFSVTRAHNAGAAFGLLQGLPVSIREPFFYLVPGLTLAAILFVFYRLRENQLLGAQALSLIVGGAVGNLVDRFRLGYVIDFVDLHWGDGWHFPAFNVADTAISLGVGLLLLGMIQDRDAEEKVTA
jgi:signal peptidase II